MPLTSEQRGALCVYNKEHTCAWICIAYQLEQTYGNTHKFEIYAPKTKAHHCAVLPSSSRDQKELRCIMHGVFCVCGYNWSLHCNVGPMPPRRHQTLSPFERAYFKEFQVCTPEIMLQGWGLTYPTSSFECVKGSTFAVLLHNRSVCLPDFHISTPSRPECGAERRRGPDSILILVLSQRCWGHPDKGDKGLTPNKGHPDKGDKGLTPNKGHPDKGDKGLTPNKGHPDKGDKGLTPNKGHPDKGYTFRRCHEPRLPFSQSHP
jgi:hypothetical protein